MNFLSQIRCKVTNSFLYMQIIFLCFVFFLAYVYFFLYLCSRIDGLFFVKGIL
jgi:hypothetical protein